METATAFNARLTPAERQYRIYVRGNDLIFIQLAGLSTAVQVLTVHFGVIGMLVGESLKRRAKAKAEAALQRTGEQDPELLLDQNDNNFRVYSAEIREATIEPPARFQWHGKQAGRWNFVRHDGKKMRFEFENVEDMKTALDLLPRLLGTTLKVNVEWDETKKQFQAIQRHLLT